MTDWLPTLYTLAGGSASKLRNVDGYNVWDTLSSGKSSPRQELLHNIHPSGGEAAMRYGQWKILVNAGENNKETVFFGLCGSFLPSITQCREPGTEKPIQKNSDHKSKTVSINK